MQVKFVLYFMHGRAILSKSSLDFYVLHNQRFKWSWLTQTDNFVYYLFDWDIKINGFLHESGHVKGKFDIY